MTMSISAARPCRPLALGTTTFSVFGVPVNTAPFFNSATTSVSTRFHVARVGVNYRMNLFSAPAPVLAKY